MDRFIIVGERRSGSTTLAKWMQDHDEIGMLSQMDRAYFMDDELRGRKKWLDGVIDHDKWLDNHNKQRYENLFSEFIGKKIVGEKSADYLFLKQCLVRIKLYYPEVKLLVTLRNPVHRAWSHYVNEVGKGRENLPFSEAIALEDTRILKSEYALTHLSYKNRGFYDLSLEALFALFPKEQIQIVILDELIANPKSELKKVYEFLNIDTMLGYARIGKKYNNNWTTFPKPFWKKNQFLTVVEKNINQVIRMFARMLFRDIYKRRRISVKLEKVTRYGKDDMHMPENTRQELMRIYAPHIDRLETLIAKDLSSWK
jgi:hypothetical protein